MASQRPPIQRIGIVGAGASGIASAKSLLAEKCFKTVEILEQRSETGGVWNYTTETDTIPIPSANPGITEEPVINEGKPVFVSAMYDELETNVPKKLMSFDGFPFPDNLPLFPPHSAIRKYLQEYSKDVQDLITFNAKVVDCRKEGKEWEVIVRDTRTGILKEKRIYDAVIVATGHHNIPYIPPLPGLDEWVKTYQGSVSHSKNFRKPDLYSGKKVVVIGNAASGIDIAAQVCKFSRRPLIQSSRSRSLLSIGSSPSEICEVSEVTAFSVPSRSVHFSDGRIETGIDCIIFCTGYLYSIPFLSNLNSGQNAPITDGMRVNHVYQHIFYIPDPTLSIIGLPVKVIPFPTAQAAAALVARVWATRVSLPPPAEMRRWENCQIAENGNGKEFHYMNFPRDVDYIEILGSMCGEATREGDSGIGIKPPVWGAEERWTRPRFPRIKRAYIEMKKKGIIVRTQEELGFDYRLGKDGFEATEKGLEKL